MTDNHANRTDFAEDPRYKIATREMLIALAYWVLYTIVITAVAMGIGYGKSSDELHYIAGFPAWFFWSAGPATLLFCLIPHFIAKYLFKPMSLDPHGDEGEESETDGKSL